MFSMRLFTFKKESQQPKVSSDSLVVENEKPKVSKELFVNNEQPEESDYPIYVIYRRLNSDMETRGYQDAKSYPDSSYSITQQELIIKSLKLDIQEARLRYRDMLIMNTSIMDNFKKMGLIEGLKEKEFELQKLNCHLDELTTIEKDITENGERVQHILGSYKQGFNRGLVEILNSKK